MALIEIRRRIRATALKAGRSPQDILLVAVSKKKSPNLIEAACQEGQEHFGENYAQEFVEKYESLKRKALRWHFVGHLQRRKVRDVVGRAWLIHSVDSSPLALEIEKRAAKLKIIQKCLLQVNLSGEPSKSGVDKEDLEILLKEISTYQHLAVTGLMTLPPLAENPETNRPHFRELASFLKAINEKKIYPTSLTELSMGMTADFEVAIEEGATLVRIGTAIFGERV